MIRTNFRKRHDKEATLKKLEETAAILINGGGIGDGSLFESVARNPLIHFENMLPLKRISFLGSNE